MAVVNRCAIGVAPKPPLLAWARQVCGEAEVGTMADEHSLYLLPAYESVEEGMALLEQNYKAIFTMELELWCREEARWPAPRSFAMFREWFGIRFYPLILDLCTEELGHEEVDAEFLEEVRRALGDTAGDIVGEAVGEADPG
jgi:hypothetical protein